MANFSTYAEESILNHVFRNVAFTSPTAVYLGIAGVGAAEELEAGTLTSEITDYDGDRPAVVFTAPTQDQGEGYIENNALIELEEMDAAEVAYTFISDSATKGSGNILAWSPVVDGEGNPTTRNVEQDGILRLNPGNVRYRLG